MTPVSNLQLAPLGAGDLIDRAVRLYRRHLTTFLRIAAPPVVVAAVGKVLWTISWRSLFAASENDLLAVYAVLTVVSLFMIAGGYVFNLVVMGGAARNVVANLLWGEPVSARATYSAVRSRFWSLLAATMIVAVWAGLSVTVAFIGWYSVVVVVALGAFVLATVTFPVVSAIAGILGFIVASFVALWLFFFMLGRVAYVPQILLVEGKGVWDSLGRSFSLAKGNVRRLMAMTLFITFATYSALMILVIPLGWYGYLNGIDPTPWNSASWPTWYAIGNSVVDPISSILLTPIWMLGLSLMYVDERVRHEGYDIELLASQRLGEVPDPSVTSPFGPAISIDPRSLPPPPLSTSGRVLGLS
ncbi:MAG TPA: hypothetical protein VJ023_03000 [Pyrinomonadaceae bacterium]|nr:hypothetical protein [Pyrinomonadaceae bacterium]